MITIALDESGSPEKVVKKCNNEIFFIAGIIYDDKKIDVEKKIRKIKNICMRL